MSNKKTRAAIVLIILLVGVILTGTFTLGRADSFPSNAWVQPDNGYDNYVYLKFTDSNNDYQKLSSVYFFVGKIYGSSASDNSVSFTVGFTSSTPDSNGAASITSSYKFTAKTASGVTAENGQYAWHKLDITTSGTKNTIKINTSNCFELNEIVFLDKDGNALPVDVLGASTIVKGSSDKIPDTIVYKTKDNLPEGHTAFALIDEQDKFVGSGTVSKYNAFTAKEQCTLDALLDIIQSNDTYKATFVDKTSGVLGLELILTGVAVFGVNPLGMRIVPFIFFIVSICAAYLLGKKVFGNSDYGLITAVLYTLSGYFLTLGSVGGTDIFAVTFLLFSFYFLADYYGKCRCAKNLKRNRTMLVPLLLSGLFFALAVCSKVTALYAVVGWAIVYALSFIKMRASYKALYPKMAGTVEQVELKSAFSQNIFGMAVGCFLGMIVFTFMCLFVSYAFVYNAYASYYGVDNLFTVVFGNQSAMFGAVNTAQGASSVWSWLIAAGSELMYSPTGAAEGDYANYYLAVNAAVQYLGLFALIYCANYLFVFAKKAQLTDDERVEIKRLTLVFAVICAMYVIYILMFAIIGRSVSLTDYAVPFFCLLACIPLCAKIMLMGEQKPLFNVGGSAVTVNKLIIVCAFAVISVFFALGFISFAGIPLSQTAAKILFGWWIN